MAIRRVFATEDGDLNKRTITTSRVVGYKDIDLTFNPRVIGDVYKKTEAGAVRQAVKNLLLTNRFEKPFEPFYGGDLYGILFELAVDPVVRADLRDNIINQIETYEPRAQVTDVKTQLDPDNNSINVQIYFTVISTNEEVILETTISRLR
tara:strand:- start:2233 stop:2682 length:450 start_codon:yes stop_codon:yes gene_type:complete